MATEWWQETAEYAQKLLYKGASIEGASYIKPGRYKLYIPPALNSINSVGAQNA